MGLTTNSLPVVTTCQTAPPDPLPTTFLKPAAEKIVFETPTKMVARLWRWTFWGVQVRFGGTINYSGPLDSVNPTSAWSSIGAASS
jgi:hypothetical protein